MSKIEFRIKKYWFSKTSQFKESKHAHGGHSLNRDFTVFLPPLPHSHCLACALPNHYFLFAGRRWGFEWRKEGAHVRTYVCPCVVKFLSLMTTTSHNVSSTYTYSAAAAHVVGGGKWTRYNNRVMSLLTPRIGRPVFTIEWVAPCTPPSLTHGLLQGLHCCSLAVCCWTRTRTSNGNSKGPTGGGFSI